MHGPIAGSIVLHVDHLSSSHASLPSLLALSAATFRASSSDDARTTCRSQVSYHGVHGCFFRRLSNVRAASSQISIFPSLLKSYFVNCYRLPSQTVFSCGFTVSVIVTVKSVVLGDTVQRPGITVTGYVDDPLVFVLPVRISNPICMDPIAPLRHCDDWAANASCI